MEYKLIVFDMDGTLLNSNKQISKKTQEAIARAVAHNKIVILNTGRNPAELEEFYDILKTDEKTKKFSIKLIPFIKGSLNFFNNYTNWLVLGLYT